MSYFEQFKKQYSNVQNKQIAKVVPVKNGAGENLVFTELKIHKQDYNKRAQEVGVVYFDSRFPLANDVFKYLSEVGRCYTLGYYLSTISLCSAAVECTWNVDPRLINVTFPNVIDGWRTLGWKNLLVCRQNGLPVDELLELNELNNINTMNSNPKFIDMRNKIAHGDVATYFQGVLPVSYSPYAEQEAGFQIKKTLKYFAEWHNQLWL